MPIGAGAAILGSSVLGAGTSLLGSGKASSAAKSAADTQGKEFYYTTQNLNPFNSLGLVAGPAALNVALGGPTGGGPDYVAQAASYLPEALSDVHQATQYMLNAGQIGVGPGGQAALEQTPGYQFALNQGLKSVQSGAAARGLGVSGASMKGAANYAQGLASQTYQQQFQNALSLSNQANTLGSSMMQQSAGALNLNTGQQNQLTNQFQRLQSLANLGESAAAGTGQIGATLAGQQGNFINAAGQAAAAGTTGAANALTSGVQNYLGYNQLQQMIQSGYNPALFGGGGLSGYNAMNNAMGDTSYY